VKPLGLASLQLRKKRSRIYDEAETLAQRAFYAGRGIRIAKFKKNVIPRLKKENGNPGFRQSGG
jgi:hypothetical protein